MNRVEEKKEVTVQKPKPKQMMAGDDIYQTISEFKLRKIKQINLSTLIKPAIFSFIALFVSFFLDLSSVPLLGDISLRIAQNLFPQWSQSNPGVIPLNFWWMPVFVYLIFIFVAVKAFFNLRDEIRTSNSGENIDRILSAHLSVIDGLATALPLIGAAILLISIKLGPEIFLGFSVPFEIKALIVLAIGKLFEPVIDTIGVRYQSVVNRAEEMKETYYLKNQLETSKSLKDYFKMQNASISAQTDISFDQYQNQLNILNEIQEVSKLIFDNFNATCEILDKLNTTMASNGNVYKQFDEMGKSLSEMAANMNSEEVSNSLKSLESIVKRQ